MAPGPSSNTNWRYCQLNTFLNKNASESVEFHLLFVLDSFNILETRQSMFGANESRLYNIPYICV